MSTALISEVGGDPKPVQHFLRAAATDHPGILAVALPGCTLPGQHGRQRATVGVTLIVNSATPAYQFLRGTEVGDTRVADLTHSLGMIRAVFKIGTREEASAAAKKIREGAVKVHRQTRIVVVEEKETSALHNAYYDESLGTERADLRKMDALASTELAQISVTKTFNTTTMQEEGYYLIIDTRFELSSDDLQAICGDKTLGVFVKSDAYKALLRAAKESAGRIAYNLLYSEIEGDPEGVTIETIVTKDNKTIHWVEPDMYNYYNVLVEYSDNLIAAYVGCTYSQNTVAFAYMKGALIMFSGNPGVYTMLNVTHSNVLQVSNSNAQVLHAVPLQVPQVSSTEQRLAALQKAGTHVVCVTGHPRPDCVTVPGVDLGAGWLSKAEFANMIFGPHAFGVPHGTTLVTQPLVTLVGPPGYCDGVAYNGPLDPKLLRTYAVPPDARVGIHPLGSWAGVTTTNTVTVKRETAYKVLVPAMLECSASAHDFSLSRAIHSEGPDGLVRFRLDEIAKVLPE